MIKYDYVSSNIKFKFKTENKDVNKRKQMSEQIKQNYPDKIPMICEKDPASKIGSINKTKFLIPRYLTVSQFSLQLSKKIELKPSETFFLLVNGKIVITGETSFGCIYDNFADKNDGFLYLSYTGNEYMGGSLIKYL